jgi:predicted amidohydrolase YtcJ
LRGSLRALLRERFIVDPNIFEIDPHTIGDTKVVTTIVGGKIVYEAEAK